MGIKLFSDLPYKDNIGLINKDTDTSPNPNKHEFNVLHEEQVGDWVVALVNYPHCTTFNGDKILVFEASEVPRSLSECSELDPHFLERFSRNIPTPVARFRGNEDGWDLALAFAESVESKWRNND